MILWIGAVYGFNHLIIPSLVITGAGKVRIRYQARHPSQPVELYLRPRDVRSVLAFGDACRVSGLSYFGSRIW